MSELCTRGTGNYDRADPDYSVLALWTGMSGHRLTEGGTECSQIAYGKLCARLFNYLIWWVSVMIEGWGFG